MKYEGGGMKAASCFSFILHPSSFILGSRRSGFDELLRGVRSGATFFGSPVQEKIIFVDTFGCRPSEFTKAPNREDGQSCRAN
jgi:hypothetical protein